MARYYSISTPLEPWIYNSFISVADAEQLGWMIESLEIDPFDSDHWLYGTGLTMYGGECYHPDVTERLRTTLIKLGHDLTNWDTAHNVTIQSMANGIEEFATQAVSSVEGGSELLVAVGDDCGFTFTSASSLGTSPQETWENPFWATSTDVGMYALGPQQVVLVADDDMQTTLATSQQI